MLGPPRDLDVYLLTLAHPQRPKGGDLPLPSGYVESVARERDRARAAMRRALDSVRYRRLVARLGRFIAAEAAARGLDLEEVVAMPANNRTLVLRRRGAAAAGR